MIKSINKGAITDDDGAFSLKGNFSGEQTVDFSYIGFTTKTRTMDFGDGSVQTVDIVLKEASQQLDAVVITGKSKEQEVREIAYTVGVVETAELFNSSADLNAVLNTSSGVRVCEDGGLGSSFSFSLNGFSGKQVKFFLDGIPMDNFGSSLTPNNFPVNLAQRVEVYKGVLPITLGSDALGGAVNIITRTDPNYLDVSYGLGSFNTHKASVNFATTNLDSGLSVRATAFWNYSDNNYKIEVEPIDLDTRQRLPLQEVERFHDRYRSATAQVEVGVVNKPYADKLFIGVIASGNDKQIQNGVTFDQVFGGRTSSATALIPTLKYKKTDLFTEGLDISAYAAYNSAKNQFIDTTRLRYNWLQNTQPTSSAEVRRTQLENKDKEALASANITYAITEHHGIAFNYLLTDFNRESNDIEDLDNPVFLFPQNLQKQIMGLAWQTKYERFTGNIFAKLYGLNAESTESIANDGGGTDFLTSNTNTSNFGYGLAATYFILPRLQVKASYENTYRLPEAVELLGDGLFTRRNPNLRPESSDNLNFGLSYGFDAKEVNNFTVELGYILRYSEDYIRLDQAAAQPVDRQFVNVGKVSTSGFEGDLKYSYKNRLNLGVNATYQEIIDKQEFLTNTNLTGTTRTPNLNFDFRIPNIPYLFANLNINYNVFDSEKKENQLSVGYNLNYVEEYFLTPNQIGANNQDNIPAQFAHNLSASYTMGGSKYNLSLEVSNLTDAALFDNYLLQKPGRAFFLNFRYFLDKL